ncbi:MAG: hypothetical protein BWY30_01056 [Tenericutes bacterium ADurb.Bin239]|jgi:uncharacterized protein YneF (UPF0154 family)|nr:MAG: hypothetical protein BWY30_01056 [Tenericutes bacterium ADurb.Bin239]
MPVGAIIGLAVFALLLGGVLGYIISRKVFEKQLKKNPPITEKQIRTMLTMMGRKPSEKQVREIMRGMQQ